MTATAEVDKKASLAPGTEVKTHLVDFAGMLGFDSCRVATCSPPAHTSEFGDWLKEGAHGEMEYMARGEEKRRDPQRILSGAKSVVVLTLNYFQGERPAAETAAVTTSGRIARYAWGDDYHDVIAAKLDKIDIFLREFGGQQKCYVDTGPVLERDHAALAGIGWHGKSTMLIDEKPVAHSKPFESKNWQIRTASFTSDSREKREWSIYLKK